MESSTHRDRASAAGRRARARSTPRPWPRRSGAPRPDHPDMVAVRTPDDEVVAHLGARCSSASTRSPAAWPSSACGRGDTVAIMLGNRPEFHLVDLAAMTLGATPFSIYITYPAPEIEYLITDSERRVAIVEQAFLPVVLEAREEPARARARDRRRRRGARGRRCRWPRSRAPTPTSTSRPPGAQVSPDDLLTLIYTSGTTGPPKGVQLSHHAIMITAGAVRRGDHSSRPAPGSSRGCPRRTSPSASPTTTSRSCSPARSRARPTRARSCRTCPRCARTGSSPCPRIWEKLKAGLETMQAAQPEEQREPVEDALDAALERVRLASRGEPVPEELEAQVAEADEKMFSGLRKMLGLDEVITVNVGAAPTPVEVLEFFHAIGIELAELWGMSETCGAGTVNRPGRGQDRHRRPGGAGRRDQARRRRRGAVPRRARDARLPQPAREDRRDDRRRRLAAHRRHRRDRRRRLPEDRRPQEGADHQRRRQEHVAGQHRGGAQDRQPADRPGRCDRRRPPLQHRPDRARRRLRAPVGGAAGHRGHLARGAGRRREGATPRSRRASTRPTRSWPASSRSRSSRSFPGTGCPAATS